MAITYTSATYVDATHFTVSGNYSHIFVAGRRIICNDATELEGTVVSSSYGGGLTTVVVKDITLTSSLTGVAASVVGPGSTGNLPEHSHDGTEGEGGQISYDDLTDTPDLTSYATDDELTTATGTLYTVLSAEIDSDISTHAGNSSAHHARYTDEEARDAVGAALVGVGTVTVTLDDGADTITISGTEGSSVGAFTDLTDTPSVYTGEGLKYVRVNVGETGLEFSTVASGSGMVEHGNEYHSPNFATETALSTLSGTLSDEIDSDISTHTSDASAHHVRYTDEEAQDAVGNAMSGAGSVTVTYDDGAGTITVSGSETDLTGYATESYVDDHTWTEDDITDLQDYALNSDLTVVSGITLTNANNISTNTSDISDLQTDLTSVSGIAQGAQDEVDALETAFTTHSGTATIHRSINDSGTSATDLWSAEKIESRIVTATGTLTQDHDQLNNLDYASAGHTGFQPAGDYATNTDLTTVSGIAQGAADDVSTLQSDFTTHSGNANNPHTVTAAQVGNGTAQWNANKAQGATLPTPGAGDDGKVLQYDHDTTAFIMAEGGGGVDTLLELTDTPVAYEAGYFLRSTASGTEWYPSTTVSGEPNTASNLGSGTGIYAQKVGVDLQLKSLVGAGNINITSTSTEVTVSGSSGISELTEDLDVNGHTVFDVTTISGSSQIDFVIGGTTIMTLTSAGVSFPSGLVNIVGELKIPGSAPASPADRHLWVA